jgi:hypothetical protein
VQAGHEYIDAMIFVVDVQNGERLRMDVDAVLRGALVHEDFRGGSRRVGQLVGIERKARNSCECGLHLRVCCGALPYGEMVVRAVEPVLYLWVKEEDRTGYGEPKHERDAEQPCVEMPAPDGAMVELCCHEVPPRLAANTVCCSSASAPHS